MLLLCVETLRKCVELSNGNFVAQCNVFKTLFLIYYFFLDWSRLNCMGVFNYVAEKLRVYPYLENGNKSTRINKEREAVYSDFVFDSTELLSECTSSVTFSQVLEADKNNEPIFYSTLAFDHPD